MPNEPCAGCGVTVVLAEESGLTLPQQDGIQRKYRRPFIHPDGSIEYPKLSGDTEPPADIDGYERDATNPWHFRPLWPTCEARMQGTKMFPTGCIDVQSYCNQPTAPTYQKLVTYAACITCEHKKTPPRSEAGSMKTEQGPG